MKKASQKEVTVSARVTDQQRQAVMELARKNDRTPSREIGRAIRFYILHPEEVSETLKKTT